VNLVRKRLRVSGLLLGACTLFISATYGQSSTRIEGKVLDQTGAPIWNATVTLFSDDRVRTTKVDDDGKFVFVGLTAPTHYLEASSSGFLSASISVTDKTSGPVSVVLRVGESNGQCLPIADSYPRASYEERSGNAQLAGKVVEFSGPPLASATLTLRRAEFVPLLVDGQDVYPTPPMRKRQFSYAFAADTISNEKGEFQFTDLEPGWYSLEVAHDGHNGGSTKFWIARENLTRPAEINLLRNDAPRSEGGMYCEIILGLMPAQVPRPPNRRPTMTTLGTCPNVREVPSPDKSPSRNLAARLPFRANLRD
jgi:Carboxypeptidase regulatory-like domain